VDRQVAVEAPVLGKRDERRGGGGAVDLLRRGLGPKAGCDQERKSKRKRTRKG
jgi:hypothetical protein